MRIVSFILGFPLDRVVSRDIGQVWETLSTAITSGDFQVILNPVSFLKKRFGSFTGLKAQARCTGTVEHFFDSQGS